GKDQRERLYLHENPARTGVSAKQLQEPRRLERSWTANAQSSQRADLLPPLQNQAEAGISLVTCAMNRSENLVKALPSWLKHREISEVVIVDWSSGVPVEDSLNRANINDPRIRII